MIAPTMVSDGSIVNETATRVPDTSGDPSDRKDDWVQRPITVIGTVIPVNQFILYNDHYLMPVQIINDPLREEMALWQVAGAKAFWQFEQSLDDEA